MLLTTGIAMAAMPRSYDGRNATVSVYELKEDPSSYDDSTADGAARDATLAEVGRVVREIVG